MTAENADKAGEDLAYVRAVVDRQRKLLCDHIPVWFAALVAGWFAGLTVLRDLINQGLVGDSSREWFSNFGLVILVAILLALGARQRRRRAAGERPRFSGREIWRLLLPWIVLVAGVILFRQLGTAAGLGKDVLRPFYLTQVAVGMTVIGLFSLHTVLGFGLGIGVGTVAYAFFGLAYPHSALGIAAGLGLVIGAYADQRRVRGM